MSQVQVGVCVNISADAVNYNGGLLPPYATKMTWVVERMAGDRCFIGSSKENPTIHLNIPINVKYLQIAE